MMERIIELKAELLYIDKHKDVYHKEMELLNQLALEKRNKEEILFKENKDVEDLEKLTFKSIIALILGNKEEKLEKEKYEAVQASIEYQRIVNDYNIKSEEVKRLRERLEKEDNIVEELEQLQIKANINNKEIIELRNKITQKQVRTKEINEAIQAGENAIASLDSVYTFLDKADSWSTVDMFGGDLVGAILKHDNFEKAQSHLSIAKNNIYKFEQELKDVYIEEVNIPSFDMGDFVIDFMFGNIFTDIMIQSKINDAIANVKRTTKTIESIIDDLYNEKNDINNEIKQLFISLKDLLQRL